MKNENVKEILYKQMMKINSSGQFVDLCSFSRIISHFFKAIPAILLRDYHIEFSSRSSPKILTL